jgi:hypothetical protein
VTDRKGTDRSGHRRSGANHDDVPAPELSVGDRKTLKSRLLTRQCQTCIFRPGNPMHLAEGQLRDIVTHALADERFVICHDTLPYGQYPHARPAICRGFFDRYSTTALTVIALMFGFLHVDPPGDDPAQP